MPDTFDSATRSWIMAQVTSRNTVPEIYVRRAIHRSGYRFSLHSRNLPGAPDVILPKYKMVIFIHGCFWHWHGCKRSRMPSSNKDYWTKKIAKNVQRDKECQAKLSSLGWECRIIWECELAKSTIHLISELDSERAKLK